MNNNQNINENLNPTENQKISSSSESRSEINNKFNIYEKVTNLIIEQLKKGHIAWENPVIDGCRPQNLITGHIYRGLNPLLLSLSDTPYFLTFNQILDIGASLKKGSKSFPVVFWKPFVKEVVTEDGEKEEDVLFCLKYYNVFKITDVENIPAKYLEKTKIATNEVKDILTAEEIVKGFKTCPRIETTQGTPCYSPSLDIVKIPAKEFFRISRNYYSTLYHELTHSVGHSSRLNRFADEGQSFAFGSKTYAKEELTAELGASFLMAETGEKLDIENHAAYIESWLKALQNDNKLLLNAAGKAEKAVNYILNRTA